MLKSTLKFHQITNKILPIKLVGGKAYWLSWLANNGYDIPNTWVISNIDKSITKQSLYNTLIRNQSFNEILEAFANEDMYKIAIRSSATNEDLKRESFAGNYKSYIGSYNLDCIIENIYNVFVSMNSPNEEMNVILQEYVEPVFSGVVFSTNPISEKKNEVLINYIEGHCEDLVSGEEVGKQVLLVKKEKEYKAEGDFDGFEIYSNKLLDVAKGIEDHLSLPVDIEWCITNEDRVRLVQCRPITNLFHKEEKIYKVTNKNIKSSKVKENDKIKLRLLGEELGLRISEAYVIDVNCDNKSKSKLDYSVIKESVDFTSYSAVIIYPKVIDGSIVRSFLGDKEKINNRITCQRYSIRKTSKHSDVQSCVEQFVNLTSEYYWSCSIILMEIYDPKFTGIMRKIEDGYLVEITKGHFAAKGVNPMSAYTINQSGTCIINKSEVEQLKKLSIIEGHIIEYENTIFDDNLVTLKEEAILSIVEEYKLLLTKNATIEFGILEKDDVFTTFLIDFVDEDKEDTIFQDDIYKGIISKGKITGRKRTVNNMGLLNSLDNHFHNERNKGKEKIEENIIFCSELPVISLLEVLKNYDNSKIGFIFKNGSMLCHFAVLLREKNIPAIIFDYSTFNDNDLIVINTNKSTVVNNT